jgi:hypothetical protein
VTDSSQPSRKGTGQRHQSSSPAGTTRAGRRAADRRRAPEQTTLQRLRTPILAAVAIVAVVGVGFVVVQGAAAPAYACTTIDTPQTPADGEVGQVQPDQGTGHVQRGDKVTFPVCPPASGRHVNQTGFGPLTPEVYGPDDQSLPNGWIHNLEHGGLVLLYACDRGACDEASIAALQPFVSGFPTSAVCNRPPGQVGPVVARFEEMPTRYAALVWNRVLYLETLDVAAIYDFFLRYAERVVDGQLVAPPERLDCVVPSASPSAAPSPAAS